LHSSDPYRRLLDAFEELRDTVAQIEIKNPLATFSFV